MIEATSELLLYTVGPRVYASAVHDAVRIGNTREVAPEELVTDSALGAPFGRARGIVVAGEGAVPETFVVVDQVIGIRTVPEADIHPLPAFAAACLASGAVTGYVMLEDSPLILVDLPTLVRERAAGAAPAPSPVRS